MESKEQSKLLGTDFYRTIKIDNHVHAAAAPSAKQFVNFVRTKLETERDIEVTPGKTLCQMFEEAGLDSEHLTIDAFNVLADHSVYQRFDNFNSKYSPFRMADMRKIFLKTTNHMDGRYAVMNDVPRVTSSLVSNQFVFILSPMQILCGAHQDCLGSA
jgi:AMP deaminase